MQFSIRLNAYYTYKIVRRLDPKACLNNISPLKMFHVKGVFRNFFKDKDIKF